MSRVLAVLGFLVGCGEPWVVEPTLEGPSEVSGVHGAVRLALEARQACALEVEATSGDHVVPASAPLSTSHELVVWGLRADRVYEVQVSCGSAQWQTAWEVPPIRGRLPDLTVVAHDPARTEPGFTLLDARGGDVDWVLVLDEELQIVWAQRHPPPFFLSVVMEAEGTLFGNVYPSILRRDLMGDILQRWLPVASEPHDVALGRSLHHEAVALPDDRVLGLTWRELPVDAYPVDEATPGTLEPATLVDDGVIVFGEDGTVEAEHWLSSVLDTTRIGYDSLSPPRDDSDLRDWAHANAVVIDPADGGFLVTVRHQDAVVKLTSEGALDWILGTPSGWTERQAAARLTALGDVSWPFHPHAADIAPDGTIVLFDNGNHGATPYDATAPLDSPISRVVGYTVDPVARTVRERWSYHETVVGTLSVPAFGDADVLEQTGHVLGVFGRTREVSGVPSAERGLGESQAHLVEFDPERPLEPPALHLVLSSRRSEHAAGWSTYRAQRFVPAFWE